MCSTLPYSIIFQTPVYNGILKSYIFEPVDDPAMLFLDLFQIKIINDKYFGGCGSFQCSAYCLNDEQWFFVQMCKYSNINRPKLAPYKQPKDSK